MSLITWKLEFMNRKPVTGLRMALEVMLAKYKGGRQEYMVKHKIKHWQVTRMFSRSNNAVCHVVVECGKCPLYALRGMTCYKSRHTTVYSPSAKFMLSEGAWSAEPMINLIEKAMMI